jgi:ferredoxin
VGCDNCARKCPYGNITMRPIPEAEQKDNIVKQAIKCNLCRGYKYSNCVHECPRGALLRVNPLEHFDELALVLAADQDREQGSSTRRKIPKRSRRPMTTLVVSALLLLFCSPGIAVAHFMAADTYSAATPLGLGFGIAGAACIVFALMLGARKKLSNHGLGRLESWTQLHMTFGGIGFVAALAHADYSVSGIGTTLLLLLFAFEIITGVSGQLLYTRVPKLLTHIEKAGNSKLIEDLYDERNELRVGLREILIKQPAVVRAFVPHLRKLAGSPRRRYSRRFDAAHHLTSLLSSLPLQGNLQHHRAVIERVLTDHCKLSDTVAQIRLHRVLKQWLFIHLATSAALFTVLVLHIATMLPIVW